MLCCGLRGLCFIFDAFPRVSHQHLGLSLSYVNTGRNPNTSEPTVSE